MNTDATTNDSFGQTASAMASLVAGHTVAKVERGSQSTTSAVYGAGTRRIFVLSPTLALDATRVLLLSLAESADRVDVVVLSGHRARRHLARAELFARVIASQLSRFELEWTVFLATSATELKVVEPKMTLDVAVVSTVLNLEHDLSVVHAASVTSRFGETFLEYKGLPYAKLDSQTNSLGAGVSFAENEFLELHRSDADLNRRLDSIRSTIDIQKTTYIYSSIATSLKSRAMGEELLSRPELIGATTLKRVDVFRSGFRGSDPFSDLAVHRGGFWGIAKDFGDFLLAEFPSGEVVLLGVAAGLAPGIVAQTQEVSWHLSSQIQGLKSGLVVGPKTREIPYLLDLASRAKALNHVFVATSSPDGELSVEVVNNGI